LKSLVKNIFTTIVVLTLLISTTGFQVYKHICSTHNFSAISLVEIPVCEKDHQISKESDNCCKVYVEEVTEPSCCESETNDESNSVSITSAEIKCCIKSIGSIQIHDNLYPPVEKKIISVELLKFLISFIDTDLPESEQNLVLQNNNLPPPIFGKTLLQKIHQLKIDTPIC
jgi:hypothetical protein